MKPYYKPLKELNDKTKFYKCKVKVLHKGRPQQSPNKARYQRLIVEDDQGFTMKATLFGSDIDAYAEALQRNGHYEISNAIIKPVPTQHATRENEFTMTINKKAEITSLTTDPSLLVPKFQSPMSIPHDSNSDDLYDVIGIVIHISEPRQITQNNQKGNYVAEIYITDHRCDRPYMISFWNELSNIPPRLLNSWAHKFSVIGFTALKTKSYKGFSFTNSMSSEILLDPVGSEASELQAWILENSALLISQRTKLSTLLSSTSDMQVIAIQDIKSRMAHEVWQEERFNVVATIPDISSHNLKMYSGCSNCGKSMAAEHGTITCCTQCLAKNITCIPRATMKAEIVDDSERLELMFFSKEIELLTGCSCADLWLIKDDSTALAQKLENIKNRKFQVQLGPTADLSKSRILSWAIRSLALESSQL